MANIQSELAHLMALAGADAGRRDPARTQLQSTLADLLHRVHRAEDELQARCDAAVAQAVAPASAPMQPKLDQLVDWIAEAMEAGIACGDLQTQGTPEHQVRFERMSASCRKLIEGVAAAVAQRDTLLAALPDSTSVTAAATSAAQPSAFSVAKARCKDLFDPLVPAMPRQMAWQPTDY